MIARHGTKSNGQPLKRLLAVGLACVLIAAGFAIWESDWSLERRAAGAGTVPLQSMAAQMPGSAIVQYHLGRRLAEAGRTDEAITVLLRAHQIDPNSPRIVALLGDQLTRRARFREAGALLQAFTGRHPDEPQTLYALGVYYYRAYEHQQAVATLNRAVALAPGDVAAWRVLGEANMALGRYADALRAYDVALTRQPAHADTLVRQASARRMLNDLDGAEHDLRAACALAPTNITARYLLGELLARYRLTPKAQLEAESLLKQINPEADGMLEAHRELGRVYSGRLRWSEARAELAVYMAARPNDVSGLYLYATALKHAGLPDAAVMARYRRAQADQERRKNLMLRVQGEPDNLEARLALGRYLASHGETALAILTFERMLRQDPQNGEAQRTLSGLRGGAQPEASQR